MAAKPAIDLSTIGMKVAIAFETIAGTRPTEKYYNLQKPKSIPDMNPEPDTIDTTSLNATKYKTSVPGLLDLSGAMGFTFGMSQVFINTWENICATWDKNKAEGKRPWLEIYHPDLTKAWFIPIVPSRLGVPSAEVNAAWEVTANVTISDEIKIEDKIEPSDEDFPSPLGG